MATEIDINYADYTTSHSFRDLRSAARAKNRIRARNIKYNSFQTIHPADLPSKPSSTSQTLHTQQAHYLPLCYFSNCPTAGTADGHILSSFPADLSTAPVANFTAREAYREVSYGGGPYRRHHADPFKRYPEWKGRKAVKYGVRRDIREGNGYGDTVDMDWTVEIIENFDEADRYLNFGEKAEIFESPAEFTEVGETLRRYCAARGMTPDEYRQQWLLNWPPKRRSKFGDDVREFSWSWHRNLTGCWVMDIWMCHCLTCDCDESDKKKCKVGSKEEGCYVDWGEWDPEGPQRYSLARWCKGMLADGRLWEEGDNDEDEDNQSETDEDWGWITSNSSTLSVASLASSWTEVEDVDCLLVET